jgi:hypothetical protein
MAAPLAGCVSTRAAQMGRLANAEALVTLVVSSDKSVVADHCRSAFAVGPVLGCQITTPTTLPGGERVRVVKIVRFTDSTPSAMAFEIDLHELCHAVASLQSVSDPCHADNHGLLQASPRTTMFETK